MTPTEFHRYSYRDQFGKPRQTRHHLTADTAAQTLPAGAQPIANTLEMRNCPDSLDEVYSLCTGRGIATGLRKD